MALPNQHRLSLNASASHTCFCLPHEGFPSFFSLPPPQQPMHLFQKALSPPPSSSPSPSSVHLFLTRKDINKSDHKTGGSYRNSSFSQKRLTRLRKIRHATDEELGLNLSGRPVSPPEHPSRSPPGSDQTQPQPHQLNPHRSSSAVPLPLPLPELPLTRRPPEWSVSHLGQPVSPEAEPARSILTRSIKKSLDQVASTSCRSPPFQSSGNCCCALSLDTNTGFVRYDVLRLHIPARSAPTSGFSSPNVSPRKPSSGDRFFSFSCNNEPSHDPSNFKSCMPKLNWISSPNSAPTSCLASPNLYSPGHSPLHSPNLHSLCLKPKNSNKLQQSSSCHVSAYPLPLPPAPPSSPVLSQSLFVPSPPHAVVHQVVNTADGRPTQWQKGRLIGRGTYGSVYHGTHRVTGASCAIKEVDIIPDDPKSAECVKQLQQEISVLSQLKHRNIVQYYGSEIVGDHFYIYLEYIHPGSLSKYVHEQCGNMTESIVRNFTRHILCGLAYLHGRKTIHRDIKGANLLVDQSGTVKLADFGMAKHLTGLLSQLSLKGSPHWMAPEVMKADIQNDSNPDLAFAVDIWSLGCTIIEMFTGKPPWGDLEGPQAMFKVLNKNPPIPEKLSPEGKDFLSCCFRRDPAERPSAVRLLGHSFLWNCDNLTVSACTTATNHMDKSQSSRDCDSHKTDLMPSSTGARTMNGKLPINSETNQQSCIKTSQCPSPAHRSHCSMFEGLPCSSSMQPVHVMEGKFHISEM